MTHSTKGGQWLSLATEGTPHASEPNESATAMDSLMILKGAAHVALLNVLLIACGCKSTKEPDEMAVKKRTAESLAPTHNPAVIRRLKVFMDAGDTHVIDESVEFLDGGTFGFAIKYGANVRYVMFPHPSQWSATQKSSVNSIVLWNTNASALNGIDITYDEELLRCIASILEKSEVPRSVWRHECAREALSGKMIWTQGGLLIVPATANDFVSKVTRKRANSQRLKNSLKRYGEK